MKVGVRDIAREAGVAVSTVSHVLNGTASISREVRDRVLGVARDLGYLDQRRAKATIATMERVVVAFDRNFGTSGDDAGRNRALYQGLRRECERRSLKIAALSDDAGIDAAKILEISRDEKASGVIVMGSGGKLDLDALVKTGLSLVVINGEERLRRVDAVVPADAFAAGAAVRHLAEAGHRRLLMLGTADRDHLAGRRTGFAEAITGLGLTSGEAIVAGGDSAEAGEAAVALRLGDPAAGLDGATAIFCISDPLAEGALKALTAGNLKIPGDLSVIGCDGIRETRPAGLATVSVGYEQLAISALAIMESRLMVPKPARSCILVEFGTELIADVTVGPPPGERGLPGGGGTARIRGRHSRHDSIGGGGPHARLVSDRFH